MSERKRGGMNVPNKDRFWKFVEKTDSCWNWTGTRTWNGYGEYHYDKERFRAHRFSYQELVGQIPDGLILDHLCRNRLCVNPAHLEPVTNRENLLRGAGFPAVHAKKTTCPRGHPYDRIYSGERKCSICAAQAKVRYRREAKHRLALTEPETATETDEEHA